MNAVEIIGGLGNQFFQYAFYRYLQKLGVRDVVIKNNLFLQSDDGYAVREYLLNQFNCCMNIDNEPCGEYYCTEEDYSDELALQYDGVLYEGYWQDIRFYDAVKNEIGKELRLKQEYVDDSMKCVGNEMSFCNSVALHIRRSDYITQENLQIFEQLTMDYYASAVSLIEEFTQEKPVLYIFSDDTGYVKENMKDFMGCRTIIMPQREAYQDMYLMTKTKHNIIANSTFSWWGATLNCNSDNITVAPSNWMKGKKMNLYHKGWIVL